MRTLSNRLSGRRLVSIIFILISSISPSFAGLISGLHPKSHEGYDVKDDKIYLRRGNTGMILEVMDSNGIAKYYSDRGIELGDPFIRLGGETQDCSIFLVTFLNRGKGTITFNPRYVTMRIKDRDYFAMDYPILLDYTKDLDEVKQRVLEKSVFHSSEVVRADQVVSKFLIFPALPKKFDELQLEFDFLYLETNEVKVSFYFTRKKAEGNGT